ncbi:MAG: bacterioferritin [Clostridia bacterium]|jgi:bacterioferritin|nr:bacterioferritin [Clostridia bacterium]
MNHSQLLAKLNWFYNLELNQVDLYTSLSKTFEDKYTSLVFQRLSYIEQQHVDNIAVKIKEMGGAPSTLGDILSPIIGSIAGKVLSLAGTENILKAAIKLEQKAIEDYRNLIQIVNKNGYDQELLKILEHNLIDEDLHTAWFIKTLSQIPKLRSHKLK